MPPGRVALGVKIRWAKHRFLEKMGKPRPILGESEGDYANAYTFKRAIFTGG